MDLWFAQLSSSPALHLSCRVQKKSSSSALHLSCRVQKNQIFHNFGSYFTFLNCSKVSHVIFYVNRSTLLYNPLPGLDYHCVPGFSLLIINVVGQASWSWAYMFSPPACKQAWFRPTVSRWHYIVSKQIQIEPTLPKPFSLFVYFSELNSLEFRSSFISE